MRPSWPRLLILALLGGALGLAAEVVHHRAGVWVLPPGVSFPLWIGPVYAVALLAAGPFFWWLERRVGGERTPSRGEVGLEAALLVVLFLLPPLLHMHEVILAIVALAYLMARLVQSRRPGDGEVVLFVMALDAALEHLLVSSSLYAYATSRWLLPLWLAPLWGGLGLGLRRLYVLTRVP